MGFRGDLVWVLHFLSYTAYINDMPKVSSSIKSTDFADDTKCLSSGHNLSQICETASTELDKLFRRLTVNKLSQNIAKIQNSIFGNKQCETNHSVSINGTNINRVVT